MARGRLLHCRYNKAQHIEECRIKAIPRILFRLAAGVGVFLLVAFAALVLWLRYAALPNADRYREDIVASIEKSSGMAVKVRALAGGWGGLRPVVSLSGVEIADRAGRAAFQLERAEVTLSWWSLLAGQLRFHDVDFYRPDLVLRRGADGLIYLADKPINAAGPGDGAFTEWLLSQPRLGIHDATLTWRDDFAGAPEVRLSGVQIAVAKSHGRHQASLSATPPPALAARIDLRADVALRRAGPQWRGEGQAYFEGLNADLGRLRQHLPVPDTLRSGVGSLRVWLGFSREGVEEIVADVRVRDARAQLAADVLPLELATLAGRATYRAKPGGYSLATEGLTFRLASGMEAQPANFQVSRDAEPGKPARVEIRANNIDLKIAATLLDYFPVPREAKDQASRFAPRGRIRDAIVAWTEGGPRAYSVKGRFEDIAVHPVDSLPGVRGLTGSIDGTEAGGTLRIESRNAQFELGRVFEAPIPLQQLDAEARWRRTGEVLEVQIARARVVNADADLALEGSWRSAAKGPGAIDLKGTFARANPRRTFAYLPVHMANTRGWLEAAIQAGTVPRATFELKGDLAEFPFGRGSAGRFLVEGDVRGGQLRYLPAWPSVDAIDGTFRFENRSMEIRAASARIFDSRVKSASARIADMTLKPVLEIEGDVDTTGSDSVRFLRESPLVNGPGAFTRAIGVEGPARLKLGLVFAFGSGEPVRVNGDYQFAGATATVGRALALRDLRGRLNFTEKGVRAPELTGTLFGKPASLALSPEPDGRLLTVIDGAIDAHGLAPYLPAAIAARISGETTWKARVLSGAAQGTEVSLFSELAGLASTLPAPGTKAAAELRPISVRIERVGTENELATATLAGGISWRSTRFAPGGADRWQVALKMGAPVATEPPRDGLWLYGQLPFLDVDEWLKVFAQPKDAPAAPAADEPRPGAIELRGIHLSTARLRYLERELQQLAVELERNGPQWNGNVESPLVAGALQWNPEGRGRVIARLQHLEIPESKPAVAGAPPPPEAADLPALDVAAERFDFRGKTLGRLDLRAETRGDEWRIERLDFTTPHAQFHSSGAWRRTGAGSITTLAIKLDTSNLNALMSQFGWGDYMKRGAGQLEGTLAWRGQPHEFSIGNLQGTFKVGAQRGQFAKLEPGAGKLLGLLSLQSLPRRATFDFRDVFSEGFAFDNIEGNVRVARGILLTEDFSISGPSAFVTLSGEVSLPQETQVLTLKVVPEVGESMAIAATVLGTPVLGLSTLLLSKLLRNPFGKVVSYEYQVTGSWDNPVVTRLSAPPPPPSTASTAEAQKK
ncbi:MAG TPA: YhdP family protein [Usitatibacter sp.]|nr:YhdP family protein [Usitatibacter sp.]